jgi:hypothetical protein
MSAGLTTPMRAPKGTNVPGGVPYLFSYAVVPAASTYEHDIAKPINGAANL